MNETLHRAVDRTLRPVDTLDGLIVEAALGFAAATPVIIDLHGDAPFEPNPPGPSCPMRSP